jgi:Fe-Mn family superoxide dismutase
MKFSLPELKYDYNSLEPFIDEQSLKIHHQKYHALYAENCKNLTKTFGLDDLELWEILQQVSAYPDALKNNLGGYYNHSLFWEILTPGGTNLSDVALKDSIIKFFGTVNNFQNEFTEAALNHVGCGWIWLIKKNSNELLVHSTSLNNNPLMDSASVKGKPLLCLDIWEHAYYLKYGISRDKYVRAYWEYVNWKKVEELYNKNL